MFAFSPTGKTPRTPRTPKTPHTPRSQLWNEAADTRAWRKTGVFEIISRARIHHLLKEKRVISAAGLNAKNTGRTDMADVIALDKNCTLFEALDKMAENNLLSVPVVDNSKGDKNLGFVDIFDIIHYFVSDQQVPSEPVPVVVAVSPAPSPKNNSTNVQPSGGKADADKTSHKSVSEEKERLLDEKSHADEDGNTEDLTASGRSDSGTHEHVVDIGSPAPVASSAAGLPPKAKRPGGVGGRSSVSVNMKKRVSIGHVSVSTNGTGTPTEAPHAPGKLAQTPRSALKTSHHSGRRDSAHRLSVQFTASVKKAADIGGLSTKPEEPEDQNQSRDSQISQAAENRLSGSGASDVDANGSPTTTVVPTSSTSSSSTSSIVSHLKIDIATPRGHIADSSRSQAASKSQLTSSDSHSLGLPFSRLSSSGPAVALPSTRNLLYPSMPTPLRPRAEITRFSPEDIDILNLYYQYIDVPRMKRLNHTLYQLIQFLLKTPCELPETSRLARAVDIMAGNEGEARVLTLKVNMNSRKTRISGILSQGDLLRHFAPMLHPGGVLDWIGEKTIVELWPTLPPPPMITELDTMRTALLLFVEERAHTIAVVSSESKKLITCLARDDFRGLTNENMENFAAGKDWNVMQFLQDQGVFIGQKDQEGKYIPASRHLTVKEENDLALVVSTFLSPQSRSKAVWVVRDQIPTGVITSADVIELLINHSTKPEEDKCWTMFTRDKRLAVVIVCSCFILASIGLFISGAPGTLIAGALLVFFGIAGCVALKLYNDRHKTGFVRRMNFDEITRAEEEEYAQIKIMEELQNGRVPELEDESAFAPNNAANAAADRAGKADKGASSNSSNSANIDLAMHDPRDRKLIAAYKLTRAQIDRLAAVFTEMDQDKSGDITKDDLRAYMAKQGRSTNEAELQSFLCDMDLDGSGSVTFDEFVAFHAEYYKFSREKAALKRFKDKAKSDGFMVQRGTLQRKSPTRKKLKSKQQPRDRLQLSTFQQGNNSSGGANQQSQSAMHGSGAGSALTDSNSSAAGGNLNGTADADGKEADLADTADDNEPVTVEDIIDLARETLSRSAQLRTSAAMQPASNGNTSQLKVTIPTTPSIVRE